MDSFKMDILNSSSDVDNSISIKKEFVVNSSLEVKKENLEPLLVPKNELYLDNHGLEDQGVDVKIDEKYELEPSDLGDSSVKQCDDSNNMSFSTFIKEERNENDFTSLRLEESFLENVTRPVKSENKVKRENEELGGNCGEWVFNREEVHVKDEAEEDNSKLMPSKLHGYSMKQCDDSNSLHPSAFTKEELKDNDFDVLGFEQFNSENIMCPVKCENEEMIAESNGLAIKQEEILVNSEDEQDYSHLAYNALKKDRNIGNNVLEDIKCSERPVQTTHNFQLKNRNKLTKKSTTFKCDQCSYQTINKHSLRTHAIIHQNREEFTMFECDQCSFATKYKTSLSRHIRSHMYIEKIKTFECNKFLLEQHKATKKLTIFKCDHCSFNTKYKTSLKRHKTRHDKSRMYSEEIKTFKYNKLLLERHKIIRSRTRFKCDQCSYKTISKACFINHASIHANRDELPMFQIIYKNDLKNHGKIHENPEELPTFQCNQCSYQTIYKRAIKCHTTAHKNREGFAVLKCSQCSFQTIYQSSFKNHVMIHKKNLKKCQC